MLRHNRFDWITITSPEAATVFRDAWLAAAQPTVQVAVVGAGTSKALNSMEPGGSLNPAFTPTTVRRHAPLYVRKTFLHGNPGHTETSSTVSVVLRVCRQTQSTWQLSFLRYLAVADVSCTLPR